MGFVVLYFCLDTKVPKNQDLYKNGLGSKPLLLKFRNSLRSNSRNFFTQERPASTLRDGNFCNGRGIRKEGSEGICRSFSYRIFRCFRPFWKKMVRRMEKSLLEDRPRIFATFVSMTKVGTRSFSYLPISNNKSPVSMRSPCLTLISLTMPSIGA